MSLSIASSDENFKSLTTRYFKSKASGLYIFHKSWLPSASSTKAVLYLIHGYAEHCSRYERFGNFCSTNGIALHAFDWEANGQSEGTIRCYLPRIQNVADDLIQLATEVSPSPPGVPRFLLGHSTGGVVALQVLQKLQRPFFSGAIFTSIALYIDPSMDNAFNRVMGNALLNVWPSLAAVRGIPSGSISNDPEVSYIYDNDALVYHGDVRIATGMEIKALTEKGRDVEYLKQITLPVAIYAYSDDKVVNVQGSEHLKTNIGSKDISYRVYSGKEGGHELLFEQVYPQVHADILSFITRLSTSL
jgi:acylglycerol lipase